MSAATLPQMMHGEMDEAPGAARRSTVGNGMSTHEASRAKKAIEVNGKAIENRIRYFQREEEKIWRDLEEVRRQASTIEEGRTRTLEKKLADRTINEEKQLTVEMNRAKASNLKVTLMDQRKRNQFATMRDKQVAGQEQRRQSQEILRQKKMREAQVRLQNSEKAVAVQRTQLEAKLKVNEERQARVERMREQQEHDRLLAQGEVEEAESRLPQLEAEELVCLQRLQNSRIVTQSVLEELEHSLGKQSSVASLLRSKQKGESVVDMSPNSLLGCSIHEDSPNYEINEKGEW